MHNITISPPALTEMLDSAPAGVLVAAENGRILYANAALARLFGYEAAALLKLRVEDLLPERYRAAHSVFRAGFAGHPQPRAMGDGRELYALHAAGHEFPIEIGSAASCARASFVPSPLSAMCRAAWRWSGNSPALCMRCPLAC